MTTIRRLTCDDLFNYNNVNLDFFTETVRRQWFLCEGAQTLACKRTFHKLPAAQSLASLLSLWTCKYKAHSIYSRAQFDLAFYLEYLAKWPEYCLVAEGPGRQVMGYIVGKVEGQGEHWHGHVTAVTVAPDFRCAKTGKRLRTEC